MPLQAREYEDARQLFADAAARRERLFGAPAKAAEARALAAAAERERERQEAEAAERRRRQVDAIDRKLALDAVVYKVLDAQQVWMAPKHIIGRVAKVHGFTRQILEADDRRAPVHAARLVAIVTLLHAYPHMSRPAMGRHLGNRDHSTIVHALTAATKRGVQPLLLAVDRAAWEEAYGAVLC